MAVGQPPDYPQYQCADHETERHEDDSCHHQGVQDGLASRQGGNEGVCVGGGGESGIGGRHILQDAAMHADVAHVWGQERSNSFKVEACADLKRGDRSVVSNLDDERPS